MMHDRVTKLEAEVAELKGFKKMVDRMWAALAEAVSNPVPPDPPPGAPFTVVLSGDQTEQGAAIWEISSDNAYDLEISNASGGVDAFSFDGQYLAIKTQAGTNDGEWYAYRLTDQEWFLLGDVTAGGHLNLNLVWAPTGNDFFLIEAGKLKRKRIDGTTVTEVDLPANETHYSAGVTTDISYRLEIGSTRDTPAITVYHTGGTDSNGILRFDPDTLSLDTTWWFKDAFDAGVAAGHAEASIKLTNLVSFGAGYAGKRAEDQTDIYFVPNDGSDAVEIVNDVYPGPTEAANTDHSHPAFQLQSDGTVLEVVGRDGSNEGDINSWGYPPEPNQANRTRRLTINKENVRDLFTGTPAANQFGFAHAEIGDACAAVTWRYWDGLATDVHAEGLSKIRLSDGAVWPITEDLIKREGSDFHTSARPSISRQDSHAAAMFENLNGSIEVVGGRVDVKVYDMTTPQDSAEGQAAISDFQTQVNSAGYLTQRQSMIDQATEYNNSSALQPPYYAQSIYTQSEINAAEVLDDSTYIDRLFLVWDALKAAHNLDIVIDSGGNHNSGATGYSNPWSSKGATTASFKAVENAPFLYMGEWCNAVMEGAVRIVEGDFATVSQKDAAKDYFRWCAVHIAERYMTSSFWGDLNVYVERAAANNNNGGSTWAWDDKYFLAGAMLARMEYWLPQWGDALPNFMTVPGLPTGRPRMDHQTWYRHMIGESLALGENTGYHGFPVVSGSVILPNGSSYLAPNAGTVLSAQIDDFFHDARRLLWHRAVEETQLFLDTGTEDRHNLHTAAFTKTVENMVYLNGSCWDTYYRTDSTDRDEQADGGKKPVWTWGWETLNSVANRDRFQHIAAGAQLDGADPCFLAGYDDRNLANIQGFIALAHMRSRLT